jgi:para-nitrobenzyl esterase
MRTLLHLLPILPLVACVQGTGPTDDDGSPDDDSADNDTADDDSGDDDAPCGDDVPLDDSTVRTDIGAVRGGLRDGGLSFLGLPFAEAPLGDLRFAPPIPATCEDGLRDAGNWGPLCPQLDEDGEVTGDEDCLQLNVFLPVDALPDTAGPRPVLFFVHGGAHVVGGASVRILGEVDFYDGALLAQRTGSIVVTTQYRLGALGFLALPSLESELGSSGNVGLLDVVEALSWVRRNIGAFGGDPQRVLLFGESAGAVQTCALLQTPSAFGLFSAALMESGACTSLSREDAEANGALYLDAVGCAGADDEPACLRALPASTHVEAVGAPSFGLGLIASPVDSVVDGAIRPLSPGDALEAGSFADVPFALGTNADETAQWVPPLTEQQYLDLLDAAFGPLAPNVEAQYPLDGYPTPRLAWVQLTTDVQFACPARRVARNAAENFQAPVFGYLWQHHPSLAEGPGPAFHGLELSYLFQRLDALEDAGIYFPDDDDRAVEAAMAAWWSALAHDGLPGAVEGVTWEPYDPETDRVLALDATPGMASGLRRERCDFWDFFLPEEP